LLDFITHLIRLVLDKGLPAKVVIEVFLLNLPWMLALSIPMAVLVAVLMAFGRLSQDNEVIALKASGISIIKMIFPVFVVTACLVAALIFFNNTVLPEANHKASKLMGDITRKKPLVFVEEGMLIDEFKGFKIQIQKIDVKTGTMEGVKIFQEKPNGKIGITTAKRGFLEYVNNRDMLKFILFDGEILEPDKENQEAFYRTVFTEQAFYIKNQDESFKRTNRKSRGDREMSAVAMLAEISKRKAEKEKSIDRLSKEAEKHFLEVSLLAAQVEALNPAEKGRIIAGLGMGLTTDEKRNNPDVVPGVRDKTPIKKIMAAGPALINFFRFPIKSTATKMNHKEKTKKATMLKNWPRIYCG